MLNGVAALSTSDAWAVGSYNNTNSPSLTLTEHWNGSVWSVVTSPNPSGAARDQLLSVTAISINDAWAIGSYAVSNAALQTLIEHWNGSAWSVVTSPNPTTNNAQLASVIAISDKNVWAVGYSTTSAQIQQTLIEHWDGSAWSVVTSPNPAGVDTSSLLGIAAISANNIWAVGFAAGKSSYGTLIEHWNGSTWSIVSSPKSQSYGSILNSVTAISASNIWAVGTAFDKYGSSGTTLIEHWNGSAWNIVSSPNATGSVNNQLRGIAAISASNIWAVGQWDTGHQSFQVLIEHWNGSTWSITSSPNAGSIPNVLEAVTQVPATSNVWAVGYHFNNNLSSPLIESYC